MDQKLLLPDKQTTMKILVVLFTVITCTLACGGGTEGPANYVEADAKKIFKRTCLVCHGADGKLALNGAKDLTKTVMMYEERVAIITNGRGAMTGFKGILTEEEIAQVAKYSASLAGK